MKCNDPASAQLYASTLSSWPSVSITNSKGFLFLATKSEWRMRAYCQCL